MFHVSPIRLFLSFLVLLTASSVFVGDLEIDNKPVAVLELMNMPSLSMEASGACLFITATNQLEASNPTYRSVFPNYERERMAALSHIQTVGLVAKKKNGGRTPGWVAGMSEAARGAEAKPCFEIADQVMTEEVQLLKNQRKSHNP